MKPSLTYMGFTMLVMATCIEANQTLPVVNSIASTTEIKSQGSIQANNLFTIKDAEKVMGESAHLMDSATKMKGEAPEFIDSMSIFKKDATTFHCGYMANARDEKTGNTGVVYFGFEHYGNDSLAKKVYSFYKKSNINAIGYKELNDIGDEAWFGSSPLFVYARKGNKIFVIKVNKMTSMTSTTEFNGVARKIAGSL